MMKLVCKSNCFTSRRILQGSPNYLNFKGGRAEEGCMCSQLSFKNEEKNSLLPLNKPWKAS